MTTNLNYVKWIHVNKITIFCEDMGQNGFLKIMGARRKFFDRKTWIINCKNEHDLADKLQRLNDNGFMFSGGPYGWNPVDIFILMREKNLVSGKVTEIVWRERGQALTRVL